LPTDIAALVASTAGFNDFYYVTVRAHEAISSSPSSDTISYLTIFAALLKLKNRDREWF
jgi:hypothetical protein